jgi:hypothetical protein
MEKMSITKRLSVKAEKPQDQTCASKAQQIIDHMLADPTTGLSESLEKASVDAMFYGSSVLEVSNGGTDSATITAGPYITHIGNSATVANILRNPTLKQTTYPPQVRLRKIDLEEHPAFELTVEQLRAAWILAYGTRWVSMEKPMDDDYLNVVAHRLIAFGEIETHNLVDQWIPMGRIKT